MTTLTKIGYARIFLVFEASSSDHFSDFRISSMTLGNSPVASPTRIKVTTVGVNVFG